MQPPPSQMVPHQHMGPPGSHMQQHPGAQHHLGPPPGVHHLGPQMSHVGPAQQMPVAQVVMVIQPKQKGRRRKKNECPELFACPAVDCGKTFASHAGLYLHKRSKHPEIVVSRQKLENCANPLTCPYPGCGKTFVSAGGLCLHRQSKHPDQAGRPLRGTKKRTAEEAALDDASPPPPEGGGSLGGGSSGAGSSSSQMVVLPPNAVTASASSAAPSASQLMVEAVEPDDRGDGDMDLLPTTSAEVAGAINAVG
eukprot:CAMPEP_0174714966 /NCGR_PEP_ID=MMETSP1094-20130205/19754_1 /TAXON_ID=156173 /ORGANISM="Chrysochromulina brevifilum, Strain UTEX LB 985" /LENGTH=251 /DNA_ID=CAMNT_0015914439 /DNA_START=70 /DNA_END=825 /DNA_ORIENTATION=+